MAREIGRWARTRQFTPEGIAPIPPDALGVYVIFYARLRPLYAGRGQIKVRLRKHLTENGNRYVAMAVRNGTYLTYTYMELLDEHQAEADLIKELGGDFLPGIGPSRLANLMRGSDPADR
jgi:hypothetical protein